MLCYDAAEVHSGKSVSRCLCSVTDLSGTRISQPTGVSSRTPKREICSL